MSQQQESQPSSKCLQTPYLLQLDTVASHVQCCLTHFLKRAFRLPAFPALSVTGQAPGDDKWRFLQKTNQTVTATLELTLKDVSPCLTFEFPYPVEGVFMLSAPAAPDGRAKSWIWHPRLVGRPGVRLLRRYTSRSNTPVTCLRLDGLQQGTASCYIELDLDADHNNLKDGPEHVEKTLGKRTLYLPGLLAPVIGTEENQMESQIADRLNQAFPWNLIQPSSEHSVGAAQQLYDALQDIYSRLADANRLAKANVIFDAQDVGWQRLYTYSAFLIERILTVLVEMVLTYQTKKNSKGDLTDFWKTLPEQKQFLVSTTRLLQSGWLHALRPVNGLEVMARLTSLQRYNYRPDVLERLPARWRQNHPSFQGLICPVESPESMHVGITLHLARGVQTDALGHLYRAAEDTRDADLGQSASLVPFFQHNDGLRAMMGAKNLKQGVPVKGREAPWVGTGHEEALEEALAELRAKGVLGPDIVGNVGVNLLVAYLPWYGWNMDDGIVVSKRLVTEGILDWETEETVVYPLQPGWRPAAPSTTNALEKTFQKLCYTDEGLRRPGPFSGTDPLAFLGTGSGAPAGVTWNDLLQAHSSQKYPSGGLLPTPAAELIAITFNAPPQTAMGGSLTVQWRRRRPLQVGDKLMGRHGNKGIVAKILPEDELPRLPADNRLPKELRGRPIDVLLNPHGVISRMNLGQLLETSLGWRRQLGLESLNQLVQAGQAFRPVSLTDWDRTFTEKNGHRPPLLDAFGRIHLVLPGGRPTAAPVTVGFQYLVRLKHLAVEKAQMRSGRLPKPSAEADRSPCNLITGQPVGGRRRGGGQRLGEMEIWALAANGAPANLKSILTHKSDPATGQPPNTSFGQTFQAICDHLRALGIVLAETSGQWQARWITMEEIEQNGQSVTMEALWQTGATALFQCPLCTFCLPEEMLATGSSQRDLKIFPTVADVLRHNGFQITTVTEASIPPLPAGSRVIEKEIRVTLTPLETGGQECPLTMAYTRRQRSLILKFTLGENNYTAYSQIDASRKKTSDDTPVAEKKTFVPIPVAKLLTYRLSCPNHTDKHLHNDSVASYPVPVSGGLCDTALFGGIDVRHWQAGRGGFIKLPFEIPYPKDFFIRGQGHKAFIGPQDQPPKLTHIPVLPLKYRYQPPPDGQRPNAIDDPLTDLYQQLLRKIRTKATGDQTGTNTADDQPNMEAVDGQTDTKVTGEQAATKPADDRQPPKKTKPVSPTQVSQILEKLFGLLHQRLFGKEGLLRQHGLGRRVDFSGRLVIVPNPNLDWDACGLPTEVLMGLLGPHIASQSGFLNTLSAELAHHDATTRIVNYLPTEYLQLSGDRREVLQQVLQPDFWRRPTLPADNLRRDFCQLSRQVLERYLKAYPETTLLLNRQPSLHRYSIMGLRPVPLDAAEGWVLHINPLVCKGFGADFDGDEISLHVPLSPAEMREAATLRPTCRANLISFADNRPLAQFDQDFVAGHFCISQSTSARRDLQHIFAAIHSEQPAATKTRRKTSGTASVNIPCKDCSKLLNTSGNWKKEHGEKLLQHICTDHPREAAALVAAWLRRTCQEVTEQGLSFGFAELAHLQQQLQKNVTACLQKAFQDEADQALNTVNKPLEEVVLNALEKKKQLDLAAPGGGLAVLAISGARGRKQVRQLIGARGSLDPGDIGFERHPENHCIHQSLVQGMKRPAAFYAAMNGRSSMLDKKLGTGRAGYLFRRLVLVAWEWEIRNDDCGRERPAGAAGLSGCKGRRHKWICRACYGALPGLTMLPDGFPAGLLAAQSFGERGTQLSMQSFHTAERQLSVNDVVNLLNGRDPAPENDPFSGYNWFQKENDAARFVDRIQQESGYKPIDHRHIELLWLIIHTSPEHTLNSAWRTARGLLGGLIGPGQREALLTAIREGWRDEGTSPFARILRNQVPAIRFVEDCDAIH